MGRFEFFESEIRSKCSVSVDTNFAALNNGT